ncbi:MAG: SDR family NAD(P)-dependent oxidoreductase, partial [Burkholderiaceae bacterium]|nr:SDR family NAD(P)-dependent oxidoreductase [Burkholderiaceae bacterium]
MAHDPYQILAHPFSLEGYAVIITGAGGAIGGATAQVLAQAGANVVVSDLNLENAEKVAAAVQEATG